MDCFKNQIAKTLNVEVVLKKGANITLKDLLPMKFIFNIHPFFVFYFTIHGRILYLEVKKKKINK